MVSTKDSQIIGSLFLYICIYMLKDSASSIYGSWVCFLDIDDYSLSSHSLQD